MNFCFLGYRVKQVLSVWNPYSNSFDLAYIVMFNWWLISKVKIFLMIATNKFESEKAMTITFPLYMMIALLCNNFHVWPHSNMGKVCRISMWFIYAWFMAQAQKGMKENQVVYKTKLHNLLFQSWTYLCTVWCLFLSSHLKSSVWNLGKGLGAA